MAYELGTGNTRSSGREPVDGNTDQSRSVEAPVVPPYPDFPS